MSGVRQLYYRLDERVRALSRGAYAVLVGLVSALGVFAVGLVMNENTTLEAVAMAISMTAVYYIIDPNTTN
jgi:hypothetical protein